MQEEEEESMQMQEEEEPVQAQEEEEAVQMQEEEEEPVQAKTNGRPSQASPKLSQQVKNSSGHGRPLPKTTRAEMENAFGVVFNGVNIHTDGKSVDMNQQIGAQAFTHGQDIYFNTGKFRPESTEGKRLLAHELTHVVQQKGAALKRKNTGDVPQVQRELEMGPGHEHPYRQLPFPDRQ